MGEWGADDGEAQVMGMRWLQGRGEWQDLEWSGKSLRASGGQVKNGAEGAPESGDVAEENDRETNIVAPLHER